MDPHKVSIMWRDTTTCTQFTKKNMKIKQLIKILNKYDPDTKIVLASDSEGNSYSFLEDVVFSDDDVFDVDEREFTEAAENNDPRNERVIIFYP